MDPSLDPTQLTIEIVRRQAGSWMPFNVMLAWVPMALAAALFGRRRVVVGVCVAGALVLQVLLVGSGRTDPLLTAGLAAVALSAAGLTFTRPTGWTLPFWWVGLVVFVLFLPNAAYVVTDGLHYIQALEQIGGRWPGAAIMALQYAVYTGLGIAGFWLSIWWMDQRIRQTSRPWTAWVAHAALAVLVAIGIYIGRIEQLHSWYPFTRTGTTRAVLEEQLGKSEVLWFILGALVTIAALMLAGLGWLRWLKQREASVVQQLAASVMLALGTYAVLGVVTAARLVDEEDLGRWAVAHCAVAVLSAAVASVVVRRRRFGDLQRQGVLQAAGSIAVLAVSIVVLGVGTAVAYVEVEHAQRTITPGIWVVQIDQRMQRGEFVVARKFGRCLEAADVGDVVSLFGGEEVDTWRLRVVDEPAVGGATGTWRLGKEGRTPTRIAVRAGRKPATVWARQTQSSKRQRLDVFGNLAIVSDNRSFISSDIGIRAVVRTCANRSIGPKQP